jgi:S-adenosylhomocysteine hydrolase
LHQQEGVGAVSNGAAAAAAAAGLEVEVDEVEAPAVSAAQWVVDGFAALTIALLTGEVVAVGLQCSQAINNGCDSVWCHDSRSWLPV